MVVAVLLRLYGLGTEAYSLDEVVMVKLTSGDWNSLLDSILWGRPPFVPLLGFFWVRLFGLSEFATRSLSAVAGIAAIPMLYMVGRRVWSESGALIAAFLLSISLFHIYHSQYYRYYAWVTLLTCVSYLFYVRWLDLKSNRDMGLYVGASILLFYTHTFGIFIFIGQGLYFLLNGRHYFDRFGGWLLSQLLIVLGCSYGFWLIYLDLFMGQDVGVSAPGVDELQPWWMLPYIVFGKYLFADFDLFFHWHQLLAIAISSVILFFAIKSNYKYWIENIVSTISVSFAWNRRLSLLFLWFCCPLVLPFIIQNLWGLSFEPRYTINALPAFVLLLGILIASDSVRSIVPIPSMLVVIVILWLPSMVHYYSWDILEQWPEASAYVAENAVETDRLLILSSGTEFDFANRLDAYRLYEQSTLSLCEEGDIQIEGTGESTGRVERCLEDGHRLWLIAQANSERLALLQKYVDRHYSEFFVTAKDFTKIRVILFSK